MSRPVYSNGKVHVLSEQCETCIFRPGNLMRLPPGRVARMVKDTLSREGGNIPCHSTLYGQADQQAICRGWWDRYAEQSRTLQWAVTLGIVESVEWFVATPSRPHLKAPGEEACGGEGVPCQDPRHDDSSGETE